MPLEAETHAVHSGMAMPPLAEPTCRRSGICTLNTTEINCAKMNSNFSIAISSLISSDILRLLRNPSKRLTFLCSS